MSYHPLASNATYVALCHLIDERGAIERHLKAKSYSPMTNQPIDDGVTSNHVMKSQIITWKEGQMGSHGDIESDARDLCFEDDQSTAEVGMKALLLKIKDSKMYLSEKYVQKLICNYKGHAPSIQQFLDENSGMSKEIAKEQRVRVEVTRYLSRKGKEVEEGVVDVEKRLKKLQCAKRKFEYLTRCNKRLSDLYNFNVDEMPDGKRRKVELPNDVQGPGNDCLARQMLLDGIQLAWSDETRSRMLIIISSNLGNPVAKIICTLKGYDTKRDPFDAFLQFEAYVIESNDGEMLNIARYYIGVGKVLNWAKKTDWDHGQRDEGYAMLRRNAMEGGHVLSQLFLASSDEETEEQKKVWAMMAYNAGNLCGATKMALTFHKTEELTELLDKEVAKHAISWMSKGADAGITLSEHWMGRYAQAGYGMQRSKDEASKWYRKAAEKYYPPSMFELGRLIISRLGRMSAAHVRQKTNEALSLIQQSALMGYTWAQEYLDSDDCPVVPA